MKKKEKKSAFTIIQARLREPTRKINIQPYGLIYVMRKGMLWFALLFQPHHSPPLKNTLFFCETVGIHAFFFFSFSSRKSLCTKNNNAFPFFLKMVLRPLSQSPHTMTVHSLVIKVIGLGIFSTGFV